MRSIAVELLDELEKEVVIGERDDWNKNYRGVIVIGNKKSYGMTIGASGLGRVKDIIRWSISLDER